MYNKIKLVRKADYTEAKRWAILLTWYRVKNEKENGGE